MPGSVSLRRAWDTVSDLQFLDALRSVYESSVQTVKDAGVKVTDALTQASDGADGVLGTLSLKNVVEGVGSECKALTSRKISVVADATSRLTQRFLSVVSIAGLVASLILGYTVKKAQIPIEALTGLWVGCSALAFASGGVAIKRNLEARGKLEVDDESAKEYVEQTKNNALERRDAVGSALINADDLDKVRAQARQRTKAVWLQQVATTLSLVVGIAALIAPETRSLRAQLNVARALVTIYLVVQVVGWFGGKKNAQNEETEMSVMPARDRIDFTGAPPLGY